LAFLNKTIDIQQLEEHFELIDGYCEICKTDVKYINNTKIIYIYTPPQLCLDRIKIRGRKSESGLELDFING
jgi:hypothetical protein